MLNMVLRGGTDDEGWNVHHLLSDSDVSLEDEHTGVMDGLCKSALDDEGLEASFHELGDGQTEHIIELAL